MCKQVELASKKASTAKNMDYYEISTKSDKFERLVKMASTAEQLFVFTATTPLARSAEFDQAVKESVATFNVRPNYIENFQVTINLYRANRLISISAPTLKTSRQGSICVPRCLLDPCRAEAANTCFPVSQKCGTNT